MRAVYRQPRRAWWLLFAAAMLAHGGCRRGGTPPGEAPGPALQSRRFELADFLASVATAVDSPAAARLMAAHKLAWIPEPAATPTLVGAPAGFRIAAVSPRGDRVALVRDLDPDTTEVLLLDRTRGETRLLLPVDRDARFLPQRFSADGSRLFLFTDEGEDTLQLEILEPDSGRRVRRVRPGCEALRVDASPDGGVHALQWSCSGAVEAALFESAGGAELGPLPLPRETRLARALPAAGAAGALYEVASGHFPRDLMFADRLDPDANSRPLSFGLAPAIAAADLVDPAALELRIAGAPPMPAELWWPRRPPAAPPALIWLEHDAAPPAWLEFHPFLQFLANRGVAVLRLRLRGSRGFGHRLAHAADGRLVDAGLEDLDAARAELTHRGVDPLRIAVLGEGPWAGALAATALVERAGRFAAAVDLGGDPDPLRQLDLLSALADPPRTWWLTRLGEPASEAVRRDRMRIGFPPRVPAGLLFLAVDPAAHLWSEEALTSRRALDAVQRIELAADPGLAAGSDVRAGFAALPPAAVAALWEFLRARLAIEP